MRHHASFHNTGFDDYAEGYDAALAQGLSMSGEDKNYWEHSVILTFPVAAVGTVQTPDPVCRYIWHIAGLTCDYC